MTILILAQNTFVKTRLYSEIAGTLQFFSRINKDGLVTRLLFTVLVISLASYLVALYTSMNVGFSIQEQEKIVEGQKRDLLAIEIELQQKKSALVKEGQPALESMERVTKIRYLLPKNLVVSDNTIPRP